MRSSFFSSSCLGKLKITSSELRLHSLIKRRDRSSDSEAEARGIFAERCSSIGRNGFVFEDNGHFVSDNPITHR